MWSGRRWNWTANRVTDSLTEIKRMPWSSTVHNFETQSSSGSYNSIHFSLTLSRKFKCWMLELAMWWFYSLNESKSVLLILTSAECYLNLSKFSTRGVKWYPLTNTDQHRYSCWVQPPDSLVDAAVLSLTTEFEILKSTAKKYIFGSQCNYSVCILNSN